MISNPATRQLGERLLESAAVGADAVLAVMEERRLSTAAEPPDALAAAMAASDVVLAPTGVNRFRTPPLARPRASAAIGSHSSRGDRGHARSRDERRHGGIAPQGPRARRRAHRRVGGADHVPERKRPAAGARGSKGDLRRGGAERPGAFGNLPCGEGFLAPVEGTCEGPLVVDGSIAAVGIPDEPVTLTVAAGRLADATGKPARGRRASDRARPRGDHLVAELGIGSNEKAEADRQRARGRGKILGTVHVAFGPRRRSGHRPGAATSIAS